jgi:hypothetical protein
MRAGKAALIVWRVEPAGADQNPADILLCDMSRYAQE